MIAFEIRFDSTALGLCIDELTRSVNSLTRLLSPAHLLEIIQGPLNLADLGPELFVTTHADLSPRTTDERVIHLGPSDRLLGLVAALGTLDRDLGAALERHRVNLRRALSPRGDGLSNAAPNDRGNWMVTASGRAFYPLDPRPEEVTVDDIAHALSLICRFETLSRAHKGGLR